MDLKKQKHQQIVIGLSEMGKIPPQSVDMEEIVLGQLMIENLALEKVYGNINENTFYKDANRLIFRAIKNIFDRNEPVSIITVTLELRKTNDLDNVGGAFYVTDLMNRVSSHANIEFNCNILIQDEIRRDLIMKCSEIMNFSYDKTIELLDIHNSIVEVLQNVDEKVQTTTNNILDECEITATSEIINPNWILSMFQDNISFGLFSEGSTSCISGGKGSRKSFFVSMVCGYIVSGRTDSIFTSQKSKVVIFDTEQAPLYCQKTIQRIGSLSGDYSNIKYYSLKKYNIKMKMFVIEKALKKHNPKMIVIDNAADLVNDINDNKETAIFKAFLMRIQATYSLHTCLVIHTNKNDDNIRGAIGAEIDRVIETNIMLKEITDSKTHSEIIFKKTRDSIKPNNEQITVRNNFAVIDRGEISNDKFVEEKHNNFRFLNSQKNDDINPNRQFESQNSSSEDLPF